MKALFSLFLFIVAPLIPLDSAAAQRLFLVGIPNQTTADARKKILAATATLASKAAPKDRIQVFDAWSLERIADLQIRDGNPQQRARAMVPELQKLKHFLGREVDGRWTRENQIRWPQFLTFAGSAIKTASAGKTTLILFGKAYYLDERDKEAVFGPNEVPSDGCVLARSTDSIYGCADRQKLLGDENTTVHFCVLEEAFASELERTAIRRFILCFTNALGSPLVSFAASSDVVVERALSGLATPVTKEQIDRTDTAIEIRKLERRRVESGSSRPKPTAQPGSTQPKSTPKAAEKNVQRRAPQRPTPATVPPEATKSLAKALQQLPAPKAGFVNIAAVWTAAGKAELADVDLWVRPGDAAEINYKNMVTPEGRLLRDVRSASRSLSDDHWRSAWEVCELKQAQLENTTLFLNLFRSPGGETTGIVRVAFGDHVIDEPFSFPAVDGDCARGLAERPAPCWKRIDLARLRARAPTKSAR